MTGMRQSATRPLFDIPRVADIPVLVELASETSRMRLLILILLMGLVTGQAAIAEESPLESFTRSVSVDPANLGAVLGDKSPPSFSGLRFSQVFCQFHNTYEPVRIIGLQPTKAITDDEEGQRK